MKELWLAFLLGIVAASSAFIWYKLGYKQALKDLPLILNRSALSFESR